MAEVTVSELAKSVGASVDRLLGQMKDAGLDHTSADAKVSDSEKQVLLNHLKSLHGGGAAREPKKITLKRKKVETLKTSSATAGKRTVNVEVRKKRTYVKRTEEDIQAQAKAEEEVKATAETVKESDSISKAIDEAESKRIAALEARRKLEEEEQAKAEIASAKKAQEKAQEKTETKAKQEDDSAAQPKPAAKTTDKKPAKPAVAGKAPAVNT